MDECVAYQQLTNAALVSRRQLLTLLGQETDNGLLPKALYIFSPNPITMYENYYIQQSFYFFAFCHNVMIGCTFVTTQKFALHLVRHHTKNVTFCIKSKTSHLSYTKSFSALKDFVCYIVNFHQLEGRLMNKTLKKPCGTLQCLKVDQTGAVCFISRMGLESNNFSSRLETLQTCLPCLATQQMRQRVSFLS